MAGWMLASNHNALRRMPRAWCTSLCIFFLSTCLLSVGAMRPDRVAQLRDETVDMFYHGFDNYMHIAFPEDEV
ncbi:hypothetical protein PG994_007574 [Apiospora phragmitis]|uniref:Uncharacterized protein n=1 Tax=Apiospora phragmitis TaxID=2905665 RepID=A0ABR1V162_9PEZI